MKKRTTSNAVNFGTMLAVIAAMLASGKAIEGDFKAFFGFLLGGAVLVVLIAIFAKE